MLINFFTECTRHPFSTYIPLLPLSDRSAPKFRLQEKACYGFVINVPLLLIPAVAAANAAMQLPPNQIKIMNVSSDAKDQVLRQYREQIKKTADQAASDYIKKVLAEKRARK